MKDKETQKSTQVSAAGKKKTESQHDHLTCVVIKKAYVPVLVCSDGDRHGWVVNHTVDLVQARCICKVHMNISAAHNKTMNYGILVLPKW